MGSQLDKLFLLVKWTVAVRLLVIFDFSSGYLLPIDYLSLRHLGGSFCSWEFSTSLSCCFESPVLGNSLLLYLFILNLLFFFGGSLFLYLVVLKTSLPAWRSLFDLCVSWGRDLSCFTFRDFNFEMSRRGVTE